MTFRANKMSVRFYFVAPDNNSSYSSAASQVFMSKDPVLEAPKFNKNVSCWNKSHLNMLYIKYNPKTTHEFGFSQIPFSPELSQCIGLHDVTDVHSIDVISKWIAAVNMKTILKGIANFEELKWSDARATWNFSNRNTL